MTEIKIQYFRPLAILFFLVGLPVFIAIALFCSWAIWMVLLDPTFAKGLSAVHLLGFYLLFPIMAILSFESAWFCIRYGRETLFTTFRLSDAGIGIENRRYGDLMLEWSDIKGASFNRALKTIILNSHKLVVPIAIINNAQSQSDEFREAVALMKHHMRDRWTERWL